MAAFQKILVTGSSGQLGREVVALFRQQGYQVTGADVVAGPTTDLLLDIRDQQAVLDATRGLDAIVHTAALHGKHYELGYARRDFVETNIGGALHLLEACVRRGIRKLLYTSTTSMCFPSSIDRVYSIEKAQRVLGYAPRYTAEYLLHQALAAADAS